MVKERRLEDVDTSRLMFDPKHHTFLKDLRTSMPEFDAYKGKVPDRVFFTYVALMYDINSPLWREELDYYRRKYECARLAGFPSGRKKEFTEDAEDTLLGKNELANDCIIAYISRFALPEYFQLISYLEMLSRETRKILKSGGNKASADVIDRAGGMIRSLQKVVFNTGEYDEIKSARMALYSKLEKEKLRIRPEQIVEDYENNGALDDDFSPYTGMESIPIKESMVFRSDKLKKEE